jgi:pimeloyl-ACP methyl ester carboxylesterase
MYYEVHGIGEPLILLHGSAGTIEMFGEVLLLLAEGRQVVAIDLQAYGRKSDIDRPLNFESMADDVAALIDHLGFEEVDLMGHSLGERASVMWSPQYPTNLLTRITTTPWVIRILELTSACAASPTESEVSSSARVALLLHPAPDPRESCPAAAGDGRPDVDFAQSRRRRE